MNEGIIWLLIVVPGILALIGIQHLSDRRKK